MREEEAAPYLPKMQGYKATWEAGIYRARAGGS